MKKIFKKRVISKVILLAVIIFLVFIGIIKIDMINTKALSPLGNTNENYQLVSKEFGEDFSNFIKDNSFLKIYKESDNNILVRFGDTDFKISNDSIFIDRVREAFEKFKF